MRDDTDPSRRPSATMIAARGAGVLAAAAGLMTAGYLVGFRGRSQVCGPFPYRRETDERVVALTFDDGPNEPYTSRLLDVLERHRVRATFFQVGRCAERFPSVSRRVVASGHVLGNHSFNHEFSRYLTEPAQRRQVELGQQSLHAITGLRPALYRPPWLCHWPWVLRTIADHRMQVVSGVFGHPLEIFQPSGAAMAAGAARVTAPGSILIFHDGVEARGGRRDQSVAAADHLIPTLQRRGYRFVTVDELLGVPAYLDQSVQATEWTSSKLSRGLRGR